MQKLVARRIFAEIDVDAVIWEWNSWRFGEITSGDSVPSDGAVAGDELVGTVKNQEQGYINIVCLYFLILHSFC
jgi:hypothetical protein